MVLPNDLPTDSVLLRHALTEHNRILGLPPSDSVLKRHYEQLRSTRQPAAAVAPKPAVAATPRPAAAAAPRQTLAAVPASASPASQAPQASRGGLMGWLRRLLGG